MATFPVRSIVIQCSIGARAFAQSPLCRWSMLAAKWAQRDGECVLRGLGDSDRLRLVLGRLGESPELREAHDQPGTTEDRCRHGHTKIFVNPLGG